MSENNTKTMILKMLAEGKISVEESERLLNAITSSNKAEDKNNSSRDFPSISFFEAAKIGKDLKNLATTVHSSIQKTIKQVEPHSKEIKDKMRDFGGKMEDIVEGMVNEIRRQTSDFEENTGVDFAVALPEGIENCKTVVIENIQGEFKIEAGETFKLVASGHISKSTLGEMTSAGWFSKNAIKISGNELHIGFESNAPTKAFLDLNITIPQNTKVIVKPAFR